MRRFRRFRRARRRDGFLMLDALLAGAVLALTLVALLQLGVQRTKRFAEAKQTYEAMEIARSVIEELGVSIAMAAVVEGREGDDWCWSAEIRRRELDDGLRYAALVELAEIEVAVTRAGATAPVARLATTRLVRRTDR